MIRNELLSNKNMSLIVSLRKLIYQQNTHILTNVQLLASSRNPPKIKTRNVLISNRRTENIKGRRWCMSSGETAARKWKPVCVGPGSCRPGLVLGTKALCNSARRHLAAPVQKPHPSSHPTNQEPRCPVPQSPISGGERLVVPAQAGPWLVQSNPGSGVNLAIMWALRQFSKK